MTSLSGTQIPNGWRIVPLKELAKITAGGDYDPATASPVETDRHPFPVYANAIERKAFHSYSSNSKHPEGAVTITARGTLGFSQYRDKPFTAIGRLLVVWPDQRFDGRYLAEYLNSQVEFAIESTGVPQLTGPQAGSYEILIPEDVTEQEAIAEALSDADSLIEGLERLIAKKRLIKQGAMQDLLTAKRRLPGFSGEWVAKPLSSVSAFITKGATPTTYGFGWEAHGILFLRSECVSTRGLDLSQSMFISEDAHRATKRSEVTGGDLLITITGNVGRVVRLPDGFGQANINQHIARIRISVDEIDPGFVFHQLSRPEYIKHFNSIVTGQAYPQISLQQVRDTTVDFPEIAEQSAIARILTDMDAEIQALETRLEKARQIKEGMMQNLLTGRIRLV